MNRRFVALWTRMVLGRPGTVAIAVLVAVAISLYLAGRLDLDTNQLNLLDPELRQVQDAQRITDMSGGAGFLILALRGSDHAALRKTADEVAADLNADSTRILDASQRLDTKFIRERAALFMATEDLQEVRTRVNAKLRDVVKRASPFFFEIKPTEPLKLELDDIFAKYQRVGKKQLTDEYYVSADGEMALVLIKPRWDSNELAQTIALVNDLRVRLSAHEKDGLRLVENYDESPASDPKVIEFGFTGTYMTNYDDSYSMQASLLPVSGIALLGVVLVLLAFFRRQLLLIALVVSGLLFGLSLTFGFAYLAVGQLNIITGILGGILMGFGIDFGIHFSYRLRWELSEGRNLEDAVRETIAHSAPASFAAAAGVGAAFASLCFSEFRGFSEFGLLAGVGTFLVGTVMWAWVPSMLVWLERRRPGRVTAHTGTDVHARLGGVLMKRPGVILAGAAAVAASIAGFAPRISFEYNTRALMVEGQASVRLQDEIKHRFSIAGDPVAIYTRDLEETAEVYALFQGENEKRYTTVDAVVSIYSFVPPAEQQAQNAQVLAEWKEELNQIVRDPAAIPADFQDRWKELSALVAAEPFGVEDVPPHLKRLVTHLPTTKPENHGWLTLVYPGVDLWDGKLMLLFSDEIETLQGPSGKIYHSAGLPILFAKLARIVLFDGRSTVGITAVLLVIILLINFRSFRDTALALLPLSLGLAVMLGLAVLTGRQLNFMNVIVFPIVLGYGVSHGVYLIHRFNEGTSVVEAIQSVGAAVACSTLTSIVGWGALLFAAHQGLESMGVVACFGMVATLAVSFTVMLPLLEILHARRRAKAAPTAQAVEDVSV